MRNRSREIESEIIALTSHLPLVSITEVVLNLLIHSSIDQREVEEVH